MFPAPRFSSAWLRLNPNREERRGLLPCPWPLPVTAPCLLLLPASRPAVLSGAFMLSRASALLPLPPLATGAPLLLTQVPDVRIVAHAFRCPLKIQARIRHCQLLVAIGVPREVCGRPLYFLGIPLGGRARGKKTGVKGSPHFLFTTFFLLNIQTCLSILKHSFTQRN